MEPIIISISGGADDEAVEFVTDGRLYGEDGKTVLSFTESELSGALGTQTRIILEDGTVSLHRMGMSESFMRFETAKHSVAQFETAQGPSVMSVYTYDIDFRQDELGGKLNVRYLLDVDGHSAHNHIALAYHYPQPRAQS